MALAVVLVGCTNITVAPNTGSSENEAPMAAPKAPVWLETHKRTVRIFRKSGAIDPADPANGSGVIFRHRNQIYVLTALHVPFATDARDLKRLVEEQMESQVSIEFYDKTRVTASSFTSFPDYDLVILGPVEEPKFVSRLLLENDEHPNERMVSGMPIIVWGAPHGYGMSPALGRLSSFATARKPGYGNSSYHMVFSFAAPVQPANSGGPVFDFEGRLLGILNYGFYRGDGIADGIGAGVVLGHVWKELTDGIDRRRTPHLAE